METFKHDNNKTDLQNLILKAVDNPTAVSMGDMEKAAEDHVREIGGKYAEMTPEEIARSTGQGEVERKAADSFLFVSSHDITEIWMLDMTEMQLLGAYQMFELAGGDYVLNQLLKRGTLVTPHKMLFQKYRQLAGGRTQDGSIQMFIYWSDKKLPDGPVTIKPNYHEGLKRVPVYYVPSMEAVVRRNS